MQIRLDDPKARPYRAHPDDAGADLMSSEDSFLLYPGERKLIDTGVAIRIPTGFVGYVFNRSSQGKIEVQIPHSVGIIDASYRGNIKVLLKNKGEDPYEINRYATRIAQLVIGPIVLDTFEVLQCTDEEWFSTVRGAGGFGSSEFKILGNAT